MTSSSGLSSTPAIAAAHRVIVSANTGSVSNNSRAMPANWLPCPGNNHAVFGLSAQSPRTKPGAGRSSASAPSSSRADSVEFTTNAARCSKCDRATPAVKHRSANEASGWAASQPPYPAASCAKAAGLRADSGNRLKRRSSEGATGVAAAWLTSSGRFLDDDVRVGPGESERADPGDPGPSVALPRDGLVHHPNRQPVPGDVRRRVLEMQVLRQYFVLEGQDDLDQARDPGGCLQMPDIRFHRPDQQRLAGVAAVAECRAGGLDFDWIAQRCPGPVRLQVIDVARARHRRAPAPRR